MPDISHHPSCPMGCLSRAPRSARSPGPAASPASVRVMVTSNSQTTEDCSLTPALSSLAHPRALRADSSEPLPSCPTKWPRYSSAFFLQYSAVQYITAGVCTCPKRALQATGRQAGSAAGFQLIQRPQTQTAHPTTHLYLPLRQGSWKVTVRRWSSRTAGSR